MFGSIFDTVVDVAEVAAVAYVTSEVVDFVLDSAPEIEDAFDDLFDGLDDLF